MPDLIGPNPCDDCTISCPGYLVCVMRQRWDAKLELLEALKARGIKLDCSKCKALEDCSLSLNERGHLIFIPEARP